jgi:hypothetical protein
VHGAGTGMHLSLRFADPDWRVDVQDVIPG